MRPGQAAGAGADRRHDRLRTSCGRELTIGRLALGDARHPVGRVFMDLGECPGCEVTGWAGLTVAEARQLAGTLLAQAAAAERECRAHAAGPAPWPAASA
jgi:putative redox protein